jgi:transcription elongation factor Elf1
MDKKFGGEHEYATFSCPECGQEMCWGCAVRCTNDGTGEGLVTCPRCGARGEYFQSSAWWPGHLIDELARYIRTSGGDESRTRRQIEERLRLALK